MKRTIPRRCSAPPCHAFGGFEPGVKSDWKYRVVNLAQTFDLRTDCTMLTGK